MTMKKLVGKVMIASLCFLILSGLMGAITVRAQEQPLFSFTCTVPLGYEMEYAAALIIKDSLAEIGIEMAIVREDGGTFFSKLWGAETYRLTYKEGGYDTASYWWYFRPEDMSFFSSFTAKGFPPEGWNEWSANNDLIGNLLDKGASTFDREERKKYYWQFAEEFQRDPPFIGLYHFHVIKACRSDLVNYDPVIYTANAEDWTVKGKTEEDFVTITIAIPYSANYIDPIFGMTCTLMEYTYLAPVFPNLLKTVPHTYEQVPDVAETYKISEDGLTYTFHLRRNISWSDGVPFTSADVKTTYDAILDPATGCPGLADLKSIDWIETPDDYTVVFHMKEVNPIAFASLGGFATAGIIPDHIFGEVPHEDWRGHWSDPSQVVSLGAYRIVEFVPDIRYVLEANPNYWRGEPFVDRIIVEVIPETTSAIAALKTKEVDILVPEYTGPEIYAELSALEADPEIDTTEIPWPATSYLGFNLNHPILNNRYVRLAIAHMIPIDEIIEDVMMGLGEPASSPIPSVLWSYNPNLPPQASYNPELAKEYLEMAGYTPRVAVMPLLYLYVGTAFVVGIVVSFGITYVVKKKPK